MITTDRRKVLIFLYTTEDTFFGTPRHFWEAYTRTGDFAGVYVGVFGGSFTEFTLRWLNGRQLSPGVELTPDAYLERLKEREQAALFTPDKVTRENALERAENHRKTREESDRRAAEWKRDSMIPPDDAAEVEATVSKLEAFVVADRQKDVGR